jgi:hypothetical protein
MPLAEETRAATQRCPVCGVSNGNVMTPLSLTGKYQLVIFEPGSILGNDGRRLISAMNVALEPLGINHRKFLVSITPGTTGLAVDPRMPSVAVFFGSVSAPTLSGDDTARLDRLLADGNLIIPVVTDLSRFAGPGSVVHRSSQWF